MDKAELHAPEHPEMPTTRKRYRKAGVIERGRAWQPRLILVCEARETDRSGVGHGAVCAVFGDAAGKEEKLADEELYQGGDKLA